MAKSFFDQKLIEASNELQRLEKQFEEFQSSFNCSKVMMSIRDKLGLKKQDIQNKIKSSIEVHSKGYSSQSRNCSKQSAQRL